MRHILISCVLVYQLISVVTSGYSPWRPYSNRRALTTRFHTDSTDPFLQDPFNLESGESFLQRPGMMEILKRPDLPITPTFLEDASDKDVARFLNLLTLVRFPNSECEAVDSGLRGTCYSERECEKLGGVSSGLCARGFGVCCVFRETCGSLARVNGTYFESPGFPLGVITSGQPESCWMDIQRSNPLVTQFRIDFEALELASPVEGECSRDRFIVSGQDSSSPIPPICGMNSGQHVYVEAGLGNDPVRLEVVLFGEPNAAVAARRWRLRVTHLTPRDAPLAAPSHCLQYYTARAGLVQSFNYQGTGGYTNNLNYAICIRKESGSCSITYRNYDYNGTQFAFQLTNMEGGQSIVPPDQAGAGVFNCPDDYIVVNGVRLCGEKLNDATRNIDFTVNAPVTDTSSGPFILPVRTNGAVVGKGFNLSFNQNVCKN